MLRHTTALRLRLVSGGSRDQKALERRLTAPARKLIYRLTRNTDRLTAPKLPSELTAETGILEAVRHINRDVLLVRAVRVESAGHAACVRDETAVRNHAPGRGKPGRLELGTRLERTRHRT